LREFERLSVCAWVHAFKRERERDRAERESVCVCKRERDEMI
jgi:hypothetical protein